MTLLDLRRTIRARRAENRGVCQGITLNHADFYELHREICSESFSIGKDSGAGRVRGVEVDGVLIRDGSEGRGDYR